VTIVLWIIVGALFGLLSTVVMPIPKDRGNMFASGVGIIGAVAGGTVAAIITKGGVIALNPLLITWATAGALYTLFGYRCLASRGQYKP
jgi:uncharacterized membrane protein YeaQ/YmgE (transglycosylase-associated protein family)